MGKRVYAGPPPCRDESWERACAVVAAVLPTLPEGYTYEALYAAVHTHADGGGLRKKVIKSALAARGGRATWSGSPGTPIVTQALVRVDGANDADISALAQHAVRKAMRAHPEVPHDRPRAILKHVHRVALLQGINRTLLRHTVHQLQCAGAELVPEPPREGAPSPAPALAAAPAPARPAYLDCARSPTPQ